MKNWDDFIPNDDENDNHDEDDLFGTHRLQQEIEKTMFVQDIQRGHSVPIDPSEFRTLFGELDEETLFSLSQTFFYHYHRLGVKIQPLVDNWGLDWVWEIMKHNERREEYELCSIIKDIVDEYTEPHIKKLMEIKRESTLI